MASLPPNLEKTMQRIKSLLDNKEYYEAQQSYKSTYHRQRARKQDGALGQAYTILKEGAEQQLRNGQVTCGVELGLLLLEAYTEDKVPTSGGLEDSVESLCHIISCLPLWAAGAAGPAEDSTASTAGKEGEAAASSSGSRSRTVVKEMSRLVGAAVKWAQKQADCGAVRTLHTTYARWLWQTYGLQHLSLAVAHLSRGSDPSLFSKILHLCAAQGHPEEASLFITRGVLSILAAGNRHIPGLALQQLEQAEVLFKLCQTWGPQDVPLMHFLELLLQALRLRCAALIQLLTERYSPSLGADPGLLALLHKVASIYVRAPEAVGGATGELLGDLMKGMVLDDEDDDKDY